MPGPKSAYRTLYHVSPRGNADSILVHGLLTRCSRSAQPVIWVGTLHSIKPHLKALSTRHSVPEGQFVVYTVEVRRSRLRRTKWRGLWQHWGDICPCRITGPFELTDCFEELAHHE